MDVGCRMHRLTLLAAAIALTVVPQSQTQTSSAQDRLDAIVQQITARGRAAGPAPDPGALLSELRAIDPKQLSPAAAIDRRFAETILVGRQISAEHRDGPMGEAAYTR